MRDSRGPPAAHWPRCTERGRELFYVMDDAVNRANDLLLKSFTTAEREQLHEMLSRISLDDQTSNGVGE